MSRRSAIPSAVKREIMIEASYRCAVPRCLEALAIDVHHIDENSSNNEPSNLIALCPTCHAAFHRKTYSVEAIKFWKLMLQQLNAAYDRNTISLLLMVDKLDDASGLRYEVTGDGLQAFSPLIAADLVKVNVFHRPDYLRAVPYYEIKLSEKGQATMKAW